MNEHETWILTDEIDLAQRMQPLLTIRGLDVRLVALPEGSLRRLAEHDMTTTVGAISARENPAVRAVLLAHASPQPARVLVLTDHPAELRARLRELHVAAEVLGRPEAPSEILDRLLPPGNSYHLTQTVLPPDTDREPGS